MNLENPVEKYLYEAKVTKALREDSLKEIVNAQAKLFAKQRQIEVQLESEIEAIKHWTNVLAGEESILGQHAYVHNYNG